MDELCREWGVSIRRACGALEMDRSTYHYRSRRPGQAPLEKRIREICETRVRYGARRVHVLLCREGCATVGSDGVGRVTCPPVVEYSREVQARAAEERNSLPDGSAIAEILSDYAVLRAQTRACGSLSISR